MGAASFTASPFACLRTGRTCVAAGLTLALVACSRHITIVRPVPAEREAELDKIVADRETTLTLEGKPKPIDSREVRFAAMNVRYVERDPATSSWRPAWLPEAQTPLSSVQRIEFVDHKRGAWNGLGIGAATGAVAGLVVGLAVPWSCDRDCRGMFAPLTTAGGAVAFGLLGTLVGAVVGAPTTIEISDASPR